MKIAFIVWNFPALSETFILNQITGLVDRGNEVDIFAGQRSNESKIHSDVIKYNLLSRTFYYRLIPENIMWRFVKGGWLFATNFHKNPLAILKSLNIFKYGREALQLRLFYWCLPFFSQGPYDIIHCHFGPNGNVGVLLKELGIRGKLITSFHGYDLSSYLNEQGKGVYDDLFRRGDLFLPISNFWKEKLIEMGADEKKIIVHKMGVDTSKFQPSKRQKIQKRVPILTVGRLVEKKGLEYGIKAVAKVLQNNPNLEYKIAGDGPLRNKLKKLVSELKVENEVKLLGWQDQKTIFKLMQNTDILMAPSITSSGGDMEGIPVVLMEAMASGLPVISTNHSGIPELIQDGISGFLVPDRDVDALAWKLEYLVNHPEMWKDMGRNGAKYVEKNYNIQKLNSQLVEIYKKLIAGKLAS
ncbi:MAG: glycosyltransferase [Candidatus Hodarchaeales archaeon]|jgi:colanic acid/amylovoran biosynthesis glycosyltransferase